MELELHLQLGSIVAPQEGLEAWPPVVAAVLPTVWGVLKVLGGARADHVPAVPLCHPPLPEVGTVAVVRRQEKRRLLVVHHPG